MMGRYKALTVGDEAGHFSAVADYIKLEAIDTDHAWQGQEYTIAKQGLIIGVR